MTLSLPELRTLRELRVTLARGGMPPLDKRTPDDCARIVAFRVIEELLRLFERYRRRVEQGERCRLVERERAAEPGTLLIEIVIETIKEES